MTSTIDMADILDTSDCNHQLFAFILFWSLINSLIPLIIKLIVSVFFNENQMETSLRRQIRDLKTELTDISMSDEFAKYAKIERKLNKAKDQLKNKSDAQTIFRIKARLFFYCLLYILSALVTIYINWYYRYAILFRLPDNLFYPFGWILAFPTGVSGAIGVMPWTAITAYICKQIVNLISL